MIWTHKAPMRNETDVWHARLMTDDGERYLAYVEGHGGTWWARKPTGGLLGHGNEAEAKRLAEVEATR